MDSTKRLALGTESEIKHAEVAMRFLKDTNTLIQWFEYTKDFRFKRFTTKDGVVEWWKVQPNQACTSVFGEHNFGDFLKDAKHNLRTGNFTVCFTVFIYMNYDDDVIDKYRLLEPRDIESMVYFRKAIDKYYLTKTQLKYSDTSEGQFIDGFNSLVKIGCVDKWYSSYKRKKFKR